MFNSVAKTTFAFAKFLEDKRMLLLGLSRTRSVLLFSKSKLFRAEEYDFVDGLSKLKSSRIIIFFSFNLYVRADFLANLFTFLLTLKS